MNKKALIFWAVVHFGLVLAVCVAVFIGAQPHSEKDITKDLVVAPGVFYKTDNNFHINANAYGNQSFSYFSDFENLSHYGYLQFTDFTTHSQYQVLLQILNGQEVVFQENFLIGESAIIKLPLDEFKEQTLDELELKVSISPQTELGLVTIKPYDSQFNALKLLPDSVPARLQFMKAWLIDQPSYGLSSLNYWVKQGMLVQVALAVIIWLSLVLMCAWYLKVSNMHLMVFLFLIMVPVSLSFGIKQFKLKDNASFIFDSDKQTTSINTLDKRIKNFADIFLEWYGSHEEGEAIVIVQSNNIFEESRLLYHLHALDVFKSVNWQYILLLKDQKNVAATYVVISEKIMKDCIWNEGSELVNLGNVNLVMNQSGYCVVKL